MPAIENTVTELWVALLHTVCKVNARDTGTDNDNIKVWHFFVPSHSDVADLGVLACVLCVVICDPRFIGVQGGII